MTSIVFYKRNGLYTGFKIEGHADSDEYGKDIVCAGISVLAQTLYFSLIENCGIKEEEIQDVQKDGFLEIQVDYKKTDNIEVQSNFKYMITGLRLLEAQYSEYMNLEKMEVQ